MLIGWDKAIKDLSKNDDIIARIIANYPNERMEMKNDTLHTLVRSIVGQQISVKAADAIWNRLEIACGNSINEKNLLKRTFSGWGAYGLSGDISSDGIDNDGDGLIDGEDNNEFGDPRQFATKVAIEKIAEDVLNEIMTTW